MAQRTFLAMTILLALLLPAAGLVGMALPVGGAGTVPQANTITFWVDPAQGDDAMDGATRATALATITEAWNRIPHGTELTTGYRILLAAGDYPESTFPGYWSNLQGSATAPVSIEAADAPRSARLLGYVNMKNVAWLTIDGLTMVNAGDVFHCELCNNVTIRRSTLNGGARQAHETIKVNQSQHIVIEDSDVSGSYENAIDFVAVQYAIIRRNRIHAADDWCAYVKGGSAYILVEANEIFDCGTGGFTAGQGSGFEYMSVPWLHYEAYAVQVINNVIHDTDGAGLGVNGGYNILLAYNTLYRVGARSHLLEFVFGLRGCDGAVGECARRLVWGGWGTSSVGYEYTQPIPNRSVYVYNNLVVNPAGYQSQWQQITVHGPRVPTAGSHIPDPAVADEDMRVVGNVIWNGPVDWPLGIGDGSGCQDSNPTCNAAQITANNAINQVLPQLMDAAGGNFQLANAGALPAPRAVPDFPAWQELTPPVPGGSADNQVATDMVGRQRAGYNQVGALAAGSAPTAEPTPTAMLTQLPTAAPTLRPTIVPTLQPTPDPGPGSGTPQSCYLPVVIQGDARETPTP